MVCEIFMCNTLETKVKKKKKSFSNRIHNRVHKSWWAKQTSYKFCELIKTKKNAYNFKNHYD